MSFGLIAHSIDGYTNLCVDSSGWITTGSLDTSPVDYEVYKYGGVNYLKVNEPNSKWHGYYLSVNKNGYLGLYKWAGASGWRMSGKNLVSAYNGQIVGRGDNSFYQAAPGLVAYEFSEPQLIAGLS